MLLLFTSIFVAQVYAHGRVMIPMPRIGNEGSDEGREIEPVFDNGSLKATGGGDFVCRHANPTPPKTTIVAGEEFEVELVLTARHPGDSELFISYDWDLPREDMKWFKIANIPNTREYGELTSGKWVEFSDKQGNNFNIIAPEWLQNGRAVLRWAWWGVHNHPSVEFFTQCMDVIIEGGADSLPTELVQYNLIKPEALYPLDAQDGLGYRLNWGTDSGPDFWMTGTMCGLNSDINNCAVTAPGNKGYIRVEGDPEPSTDGTQVPIDGIPSVKGPNCLETCGFWRDDCHYEKNDVVIHNDQAWIASWWTTGIPGNDGSWKKTSSPKFNLKPASTTTPGSVEATTTTMVETTTSMTPECSGGSITDQSKPCTYRRCVNGKWVSIPVDCPRDLGVKCDGQWIAPQGGNCCQTCEKREQAMTTFGQAMTSTRTPARKSTVRGVNKIRSTARGINNIRSTARGIKTDTTRSGVATSQRNLTPATMRPIVSASSGASTLTSFIFAFIIFLY